MPPSPSAYEPPCVACGFVTRWRGPHSRSVPALRTNYGRSAIVLPPCRVATPVIEMFYYTIRRAYAPTQLASSSSGEVPMSQVQDKKQDGIWIIDAEARTVYANDRMAEILGTTSQEMKGQPPSTIFSRKASKPLGVCSIPKEKAIALHSNSNFDGRTAQRFG